MCGAANRRGEGQRRLDEKAAAGTTTPEHQRGQREELLRARPMLNAQINVVGGGCRVRAAAASSSVVSGPPYVASRVVVDGRAQSHTDTHTQTRPSLAVYE